MTDEELDKLTKEVESLKNSLSESNTKNESLAKEIDTLTKDKQTLQDRVTKYEEEDKKRYEREHKRKTYY